MFDFEKSKSNFENNIKNIVIENLTDFEIAKLFVSRFNPNWTVEKTIDQFGNEAIEIINENYQCIAFSDQ